MADQNRPWRRQGEDFWRAHHEAWKRSDLNQRQYCEFHNLPQKTFECRRQIEKSLLAQIEMSLSTVSVGEYWADDGDCDEPDGDRPDERLARSGG